MHLQTNQASGAKVKKLNRAGMRLYHRRKQPRSGPGRPGIAWSAMEVGFNWFQAHKAALLGELTELRAQVRELSRCFPKPEQKGLATAMRQTVEDAFSCLVDSLEHKADGELARDLDTGYVHLLDLVQQVYMATDLGFLTPPQKQALELMIAGLCLRVGAVYKALFKRLPRVYPRGGTQRMNGLGKKRISQRKG